MKSVIKDLKKLVLLSSIVISSGLSAQDPEWSLSDGNVGIGTGLPISKLHVSGDTDTRLLVENTDTANTTPQKMLELKNGAAGKIRFAITNNVNNTWTFDNNYFSDWFSISKVGTGADEFVVKSNGDGIFRGVSTAVNHVNISSRTEKTDFAEIDTQIILSRLESLPVSAWRYKTERESERHIGPVAEDFKEAFNLGDGRTISTVDAYGIAIAAIQGLKKEQDRQIAELNTDNEVLTADNALLRERLLEQDNRISQLEMILFELIQKSQNLKVGSILE